MPTYRYRHRESGKTLVHTWTIAKMLKEENDNDGITVDGEFYFRDYAAESNPKARAAGSAWPIKSDAAGVHPSQVGSFQEQTSKMGVPTEFDKSTGQAIFRSRGHRAKYLKAMGIHDRNGGYGDG